MCFAEHNDDLIDNYFDSLEPVFSLIADCENGLDIDKLLDGPVCHWLWHSTRKYRQLIVVFLAGSSSGSGLGHIMR